MALKSNKKILIVTECFFPEEFKINDIALSWREKGYDIDVLTLIPSYPFGKVFKGYRNRFFSKDVYKDVNIYRVRAITGYRGSLIKKILKYLNFMVLGTIVSIFIGRRYDYIFGFNMSSLTNMLPAVIAHKLYKKPLTLWTQDLWPESIYAYGFKKTKFLSLPLDVFIKFIYRNVNSIAVSGKGFELKLRPYVNESLKFNYLPNWADDLVENPKIIRLSIDDLIHFTFAGNVGKVQNLENIIIAFTMLPKNLQYKSQLNIIGDGSNIENLKLIAKGNQSIVFHGHKKREDMAQYYQASDFLIVSLIDKPIFSVTVPAKTQTYIAAKKPILAIINGDTADIVKENKLGIYANPSDISDISDILKKCIQMNKNERDSFIINNDYLLETIFNKRKTIDKLLNLLIGENRI
jgi:glycosyltransferase involved in cell wall biosynthesis